MSDTQAASFAVHERALINAIMSTLGQPAGETSDGGSETRSGFGYVLDAYEDARTAFPGSDEQPEGQKRFAV